MRLFSLELDNFRQHKRTSIEFPPGVTGIIGKNGSGKTTILEAIAWALYGGLAVRGTNETIRCRAAEGDAPVEAKLTFALGPHTYTVTRRLDPSGRSEARLSTDGDTTHAGFREVTDAVTKLLGMDYQAFFTSFFTGQKELEFMRGLQGRDRAKAISQMLGYERLVRARDRANQDRLGLQREIEGLERGMSDPEEIKGRKAEARSAVLAAEKGAHKAEEEEDAAHKDVDRLRPLRDLSEQKAKRGDELSRRLELDRAEERRAAARMEELKSELDELAKKEKELASLMPQVEEYRKAGEQYRALAELQKHEARRREIHGQLEAIGRDERSLEERILQLGGAPADLKQAEKAAADLARQITEVEAAVQKEREALSAGRHRAKAELGQIEAQKQEIAEKRKAIEAAGREGKCPTCQRPLADELPRVLAGFDAQLSRLDARAEKLRKTVATLEKEPEALTALSTLRQALDRQREERRIEREAASARNAELANCERDLAAKRKDAGRLGSELEKLPVGFDQRRFNELRETGERLKPIRERAIELRTALDRRSALEADLKKEQEAVARASREVRASQKALEELAFSQEEHDSLAAAFDRASAALSARSVEAERSRGDLRAAQAALTAAENDEKTYKAKESELREKRRDRLYLQTLAEAFDRLRTDLNNRAAPELAAAASDLLSEMTDGRYGCVEVDEDYEATIRDDGELARVISGGEQDIVNLALRLAVSRMIADRAGQDLSLLVLDEVFGSLDDIRRDNVVTLLQTLKSRFEQIVLITHVESIHDAVDNCIWVDYDEATKTSQVRMRADAEEAALPAG